jgi:hypothetical protein
MPRAVALITASGKVRVGGGDRLGDQPRLVASQRRTFRLSVRHLEQLAVIIDSDLGTGDPQRVPADEHGCADLGTFARTHS